MRLNGTASKTSPSSLPPLLPHCYLVAAEGNERQAREELQLVLWPTPRNEYPGPKMGREHKFVRVSTTSASRLEGAANLNSLALCLSSIRALKNGSEWFIA